MSTQRRIDDHHIGMAYDGLQSALGYLPPGFGPAVDRARLAITTAMRELGAVETPLMQEGYVECACGQMDLYEGVDVNGIHSTTACRR
jgi:hypothetical protein